MWWSQSFFRTVALLNLVEKQRVVCTAVYTSTAVYSCFEAVACVYTCSAKFNTKFSTQVLLKFNLWFYMCSFRSSSSAVRVLQLGLKCNSSSRLGFTMRLAVHELGCNSVALDRCQVRSGVRFEAATQVTAVLQQQVANGVLQLQAFDCCSSGGTREPLRQAATCLEDV